MGMLFALLGEGCKHAIQIGSGPRFALLLAQLREQGLHWCTFIDEATDVALWLGPVDCLREDVESLPLLLVQLVSQSLQEADLNHMAPALALDGSLEHRRESLQGKSRLLLC